MQLRNRRPIRNSIKISKEILSLAKKAHEEFGSFQELENLSGVSDSTISKMFRESSPFMALDTYARLANMCGYDLALVKVSHRKSRAKHGY